MVIHSVVQFRASIWKPPFTYLPQVWLFGVFRGDLNVPDTKDF